MGYHVECIENLFDLHQLRKAGFLKKAFIWSKPLNNPDAPEQDFSIAIHEWFYLNGSTYENEAYSKSLETVSELSIGEAQSSGEGRILDLSVPVIPDPEKNERKNRRLSEVAWYRYLSEEHKYWLPKVGVNRLQEIPPSVQCHRDEELTSRNGVPWGGKAVNPEFKLYEEFTNKKLVINPIWG